MSNISFHSPFNRDLKKQKSIQKHLKQILKPHLELKNNLTSTTTTRRTNLFCLKKELKKHPP